MKTVILHRFSHILCYRYMYVLSRFLPKFTEFCVFQVKLSQERLHSCKFESIFNVLSLYSIIFASVLAYSVKSGQFPPNSRRNQRNTAATMTAKTKIHFVGALPTHFRRRASHFFISRIYPRLSRIAFRKCSLGGLF